MKSTHPALALACLLMLSACSPMPERQVPVSKSIPERDTKPASPTPSSCQAGLALLEYARYFVDLPPEAQKKDMALLSASQNKSRLTRSKLAIAYTLPASRVRDPAKAQALLDELMLDRSLPAEEKAFFGLLRDFNQENNRLAGKLKDEQKRVENAQSAAAGLQKKLDELKNIEKAMIERDQGGRR